MRALLVAGPAGAGKSTLGAALARRLGAVLLDLDTVTNTLLDAVFAGSGRAGHWNDDRHRPLVRPARYAQLGALAAAQVGLGREVVLVAPFTAELAGGAEWRRLRHALAPADIRVLWLSAPPDLLTRRLRERGETRDLARAAAPAPTPPAVAHAALDARDDVDRLVALALAL